jgi:hypothetical protein
MSRAVTRSDSDEILFWAERAASYYWSPFAVAAVLMAPVSTVDPVLVAGGMALAAAICAINQHCFVFHLRRDHVVLRGAMLDPARRLDWTRIRAARADAIRHPLLSGNGARGRVSVEMDDGTRIRITGVRDPEAASAAINRILAARRGRRPRPECRTPNRSDSRLSSRGAVRLPPESP